MRSPATPTNSLATGTLGGKFSLCNFLRPLGRLKLFVLSQSFQALASPFADRGNPIGRCALFKGCDEDSLPFRSVFALVGLVLVEEKDVKVEALELVKFSRITLD